MVAGRRGRRVAVLAAVCVVIALAVIVLATRPGGAAKPSPAAAAGTAPSAPRPTLSSHLAELERLVRAAGQP